MNRWTLTEEVKQKYLPEVQQFINELEVVVDPDDCDLLEKDFSGTELNPYTLCKLLEDLGYEVEDRNDNGWELDFWITMSKSDFKNIIVQGTGIIFELMLSEEG